MKIARALACALALAMSPAMAGAQPTATTKEALRRAYEADQLFGAGKWQEAYDGFAAAEAMAHSPVFVLFMGHCRRNQGRLREAYGLYERVAGEKLGAEAPQPFRDAIADAQREIEALRARMPSLRVLVTGATEVTLTIDGTEATPGEVTLLDPGSHALEASSGGKTVKQKVSLGEGAATADVTLAFPAAAEPASEGSLVPGIVVTSFGALGLVLGAVAGGIAASMAGDLKDRCVDGHCPVEDEDELATAQALAIASTVGFVAGGVLVVTGGVLLFVRPGGGDGASATLGLHGTF
jgi:hypothetical protein